MRTREPANSRVLILTLLLASALTVMVDTVLSPALPAIHSQFADVENVDLLARLVLTLPSLLVTLGTPVMGYLNDRIGRLPVLYVSVGLYGIAGSAGYVIDSIALLLASRGVLGIGTAGIFVTTTALIADYFDEEGRRQTVLGWQGSSITFGGVLFLSIGGVLASVNWRVPFLIYAAGLLLLPLIAFWLYEPKPTANGDDHETVIGDGLSVKSIRQLLARLPLRTLTLVYTVGLVSQVVFFMVPVELPFYLQTTVQADATMTGIALATAALSAAVISTQYAWIRRRFGVIDVVVLMFAAVGIGWIILSVSETYVGILGGLVISGVGLGVMVPNMNAWIANEVPADVRGRAFGGLASFFFLGQFLSPFVSEPISGVIGLEATFFVVGFALLGLAGVFVVIRFRRDTHSSTSPTDGEQTKTD